VTGPTATLYFLCGKMAAGKSTLARELARDRDAVLLVQDEWLVALYPGEIRDIPDFIKYSARIRQALSPHVRALLTRGNSVVLDFPGNTRRQRQWFRELFESVNAQHELHYVDPSDEVCKRQLRRRSEGLPAGTVWTTDAEFDAVTAYFESPAPDERFNIVRHERS